MPKYLMNPRNGAVDTAENWLAEAPAWSIGSGGLSPQQQFDALVEVASLDGKHWYQLEVFAKRMDMGLCEALHSRLQDDCSAQDFLNAYVSQFGRPS